MVTEGRRERGHGSKGPVGVQDVSGVHQAGWKVGWMGAEGCQQTGVDVGGLGAKRRHQQGSVSLGEGVNLCKAGTYARLSRCGTERLNERR